MPTMQLVSVNQQPDPQGQNGLYLGSKTPFGGGSRLIPLSKNPGDLLDCLWLLIQRDHIADVKIACKFDKEPIELNWSDLVKLTNKMEDEDELVDMTVSFSARYDHVTIAAFAKTLLKDGFTGAKATPIAENRRPTSKKAVAADWQYTS